MVINTWILSEALFHPLFSTDYWCTVIDAWLLQKVVVTGVVWPEKVAALHSCSLCWDDGCGPWLGACMVFLSPLLYQTLHVEFKTTDLQNKVLIIFYKNSIRMYQCFKPLAIISKRLPNSHWLR
jgi:hypothetical protein